METAGQSNLGSFGLKNRFDPNIGFGVIGGDERFGFQGEKAGDPNEGEHNGTKHEMFLFIGIFLSMRDKGWIWLSS